MCIYKHTHTHTHTHIYIYIYVYITFVQYVLVTVCYCFLFFTITLKPLCSVDCYRDLGLALLHSSCLVSTGVSCGSLVDLSLSLFAAWAQIQKNDMFPYYSSQNVSKCSLSSYKTTSGTVDGRAESKDIVKWIFHS